MALGAHTPGHSSATHASRPNITPPHTAPGDSHGSELSHFHRRHGAQHLADHGHWSAKRCEKISEDFKISARNTNTHTFVIEADEYDSAFFDKRSGKFKDREEHNFDYYGNDPAAQEIFKEKLEQI